MTKNVTIPDFLKTMIYFLLNTFFDDFFDDLKFEYDVSLLEKPERKSLKEQRLYSSFNRSLIIPILTKLISDFPILIPTVLHYRVKDHEAVNKTNYYMFFKKDNFFLLKIHYFNEHHSHFL